jgi:N-dimethylarginine dimethylaminohydrolase
MIKMKDMDMVSTGEKMDFNKLDCILVNMEKEEIFIVSKTRKVIRTKIIEIGENIVIEEID